LCLQPTSKNSTHITFKAGKPNYIVQQDPLLSMHDEELLGNHIIIKSFSFSLILLLSKNRLKYN